MSFALYFAIMLQLEYLCGKSSVRMMGIVVKKMMIVNNVREKKVDSGESSSKI